MRPSSNYWSVFDLVGKQNQLSGLEKDIEHPDFWNDSTAAQRVMKTLSNLRDEVQAWTSIKQQVHDLTELVRLDDDSLRLDLETEVQKLESDLEKRAWSPHSSTGKARRLLRRRIKI